MSWFDSWNAGVCEAGNCLIGFSWFEPHLDASVYLIPFPPAKRKIFASKAGICDREGEAVNDLARPRFEIFGSDHTYLVPAGTSVRYATKMAVGQRYAAKSGSQLN